MSSAVQQQEGLQQGLNDGVVGATGYWESREDGIDGRRRRVDTAPCGPALTRFTTLSVYCSPSALHVQVAGHDEGKDALRRCGSLAVLVDLVRRHSAPYVQVGGHFDTVWVAYRESLGNTS